MDTTTKYPSYEGLELSEDNPNVNGDNKDSNTDPAATSNFTTTTTASSNEPRSNGHPQRYVEKRLQSIYDYFDRLIRIFSFRFLLFLGVTQFLVCGVLMGVIGSAYLPIFKELVGLDASTQQIYSILSMLPYTLKPLIGVLSDLIPIAGYHKKYWLLQAMIFGCLGSSYLALSTTTTKDEDGTVHSSLHSSSPLLMIACLGAMNYELSVANLLSEGKYSQIMREHPESGTDIVSFTQACSALGALLAMTFVGPLSDANQFQTLFFISMGLCILPVIPTLMNGLPELQRSVEEEGMIPLCHCPKLAASPHGNYEATRSIEDEQLPSSSTLPPSNNAKFLMFDVRQYKEQRSLVLVASLVGLGGPLLALLTAFYDRHIGIYCTFFVLIAVVAISYRIFPRMLANVLAYGVLTNMSQISLRSALQYYYTANEDCVPDGPHFTYSFYITYSGVIGEIFMFLAIVYYQNSLHSWKYRSVLQLTLILSCLGRLVDLIIIERWNLAIGIPDRAFFLVGSSMFESMTSMLHYLPFTTMLSRLCPKGVESATFAFFGGVIGFVGVFTSLLGATVMDSSGLKTIGEDCDFSELPGMVVKFYVVLPLLVGLPSIRFLIPDAFQNEPLSE